MKEKINKFKGSITLKLIVISILSLLLLIPVNMIEKLIRERKSRQQETIYDITGKWGQEQTIMGPVLVVPYVKITQNADGKQFLTKSYWQILPNELKINGKLESKIRKRSIYKVITYASNITLSGNYNAEAFDNLPDDYQNILWKDAHLVVGISDLKGVNLIEPLDWNDSSSKFSPGKFHTAYFNKSTNAKVSVEPKSDYNFKMKMNINGSSAIYFAPAGNKTEVKLYVDWANPSFNGSFIPQKHEISDSNFTANWLVSEINRSYPQSWTGSEYGNHYDFQTFGVKLLFDVDSYQQATRSVKYGFLFVILTFIVVFFSEIIFKLKVHPIQYLIVGFALVIFYSLLISLAEHLAFNIAYLVSALVIITMISVFLQALFRKKYYVFVIGSLLVALYAFLFTVLQLADHALLIGNIGLVIILGLVMYYSRKIDWYGTQSAKEIKE